MSESSSLLMKGGISFDISSFAKGMMQAQGIASVFPSVVTNFLADPLLGVIDIAKKVTSAIIDIFNSCTESAHNVGILASEVGASTEQLSGLGRMAKNYGSDVQGVADAYRFLGRNISEAQHGSKEMAGNLLALGFTMDDLQSETVNMDEAFMKAVAGLSGLANASDRSDLAMKTLGRGGAAMLPIIAKGTEAINEQMEKYRKLGVLTSAASAESASKWEEMLSDLRAAWDGIKGAIARPLRDALSPILERISKWVVDHQEEIRKWIEDFVKKLGKAVDAALSLADAIGKIADSFDLLTAAISPALALLKMFNDEEDKREGKEGEEKPTFMGMGQGEAVGTASGFLFGPIPAVVGNRLGAAYDSSGPEEGGGSTKKDSSFRGLGGGGGDFNVNMRVDAIDTDKASTQIAGKIHGPLREAVNQQKQDLMGAAMAHRVLKGL